MSKTKIYIIFLLTSFIFAGTDGTIRGRTISNTNGQPLPGVQVYIADVGIGSVSDVDGNYLLLNVPVGQHQLTIDMIGYKKIIVDISVTMDKTTWYNPSLDAAALEGETVYVSGQKELVEKGKTSKKITVGKEAIEALPIKDASDLYALQAGVVKVDGGAMSAVPDNESKGLEEVHVRGGRTGEIAYMFDGLYIRNPIFGGLGSGTRLNLFAIKEFDFQPGGFNAEYGDAMSAVSNYHTMSGGKKYQFKYKYETSLVGAELFDNKFDELRGYDDHNFGFGGPVPFTKSKLRFWVSSQVTDNDSYRVLEFDDVTYLENDPGNAQNRANLVAPWDTYSGLRGFGFSNTGDIFGKISFRPTNAFRMNLTYWEVHNHLKIFDRQYMYWDQGQNEIFRDTKRLAFEANHTVSNKTFYTIRLSQFEQEAFQGVRWKDSDLDGYPDWFEWGHKSGDREFSDPYNADVVPYEDANGMVMYTNRDGLGPDNWTSGWYLGAEPGNYNWTVAESWDDYNGNGTWDQGEPFEDTGNGVWDGPVLLEKAIYRDGDYWLTPQMYVDNEDFRDEYYFWQQYLQDPYNGNPDHNAEDEAYAAYDSLYFLENPFTSDKWTENFIFGGSDRFFETSKALTQEMRIDLTSQLNDKWRSRVGIDLKSHKLTFLEVLNPWDDAGAFTQRFAEQWDDFGADNTPFTDIEGGIPDVGEGNGYWDPGESFDDFNGNGQWDNYVEPMEFSTYWQNTFEVPWMVINAGVRLDAVNYNTKIWANPEFDYSANEPWFYLDYGLDGIPWIDLGGDQGNGNPDGDWWNDENGNGIQDWNDLNGDGICDNGEGECFDLYQDDDGRWWQETAPDQGEGDGQYNANGDGVYTDNPSNNCDDYSGLCGNEEYEDLNNNGQYDQGEPFVDEGEPSGLLSQASIEPGARVIFKDSEWFYDISPRVGFSHVITDKATFTFNYGVYHQTPVYENIYLNTNRQEDPEEVFEESSGVIGNATMIANRTQSYEFAFNVQVGNKWAYTIGAWVKDMDRLTTSKTYRSGVYEYQVADNGDFGRAIGIDFTLENRGMLVNSVIQYTYSVAKANGEYDQATFGNAFVDAPSQEYIMPFDRTHDFTSTFYTKLPFDINAGLTYLYQSGAPYTPEKLNAGEDKPILDLENLFSERSPSTQRVDLSFSKFIDFKDIKFTLGLNIYNLTDNKNILRVYPLTGDAENPGQYYLNKDLLNLPALGGIYSSGYYDRPWNYSSPREINFFLRFDFN